MYRPLISSVFKLLPLRTQCICLVFPCGILFTVSVITSSVRSVVNLFCLDSLLILTLVFVLQQYVRHVGLDAASCLSVLHNSRLLLIDIGLLSDAFQLWCEIIPCRGITEISSQPFFILLTH